MMPGLSAAFAQLAFDGTWESPVDVGESLFYPDECSPLVARAIFEMRETVHHGGQNGLMRCVAKRATRYNKGHQRGDPMTNEFATLPRHIHLALETFPGDLRVVNVDDGRVLRRSGEAEKNILPLVDPDILLRAAMFGMVSELRHRDWVAMSEDPAIQVGIPPIDAEPAGTPRRAINFDIEVDTIWCCAWIRATDHTQGTEGNEIPLSLFGMTFEDSDNVFIPAGLFVRCILHAMLSGLEYRYWPWACRQIEHDGHYRRLAPRDTGADGVVGLDEEITDDRPMPVSDDEDSI